MDRLAKIRRKPIFSQDTKGRRWAFLLWRALMNKRIHLFIIASLVSVLLSSASAQENEDTYTKELLRYDLEELMNIEVISVSKHLQTAKEAPGIVSVITREQIQAYDWLSINDILYKQPGFFPSQDFDRNTVGFRGQFEGWNNNHLILLIDGVPHNDNLYGSAYTSEITPLFFAKSIEILRGPASALYGSSATNGVISINTLSAEDLEHGMARFRIGEYGTNTFDFVGAQNGEDLAVVYGFNIFGTYGNEYKSYDGSGRSDENGNLIKFKTNDTRESNYIFAKFDGKGSYKGLQFQLHHHNWDFETGHGWLWTIPDHQESMQEGRTLVSLSYKPQNKTVSQEYTVRYQRHDIDWNMRYSYDGSDNNRYPSGVWEFLDTSAQDLFTRIQLSYTFQNQVNLLGGFENDIFYYDGDDAHFSNADLADLVNGYPPFPDGRMQSLGPWLEWIKDKPVYNTALYSQVTSGNLLGNSIQATLGLRYDRQSFDFIGIDKPDRPEESKTFSQVSPRIGLIYKVSDDFSVKVLGSRAFRAPSPSELFSANTWSLASNLRQLDPEIVTTYESGFDWNINKNLNWRANVYHTKFENQIAYSLANNNLSTNIYTFTNAGLESELLFGFDKITGFLNYSLAKKLDEEILDSTIAESDQLTWAPEHTFNMGINYKYNKLNTSLQGHYQGEVQRRSSDRLVSTNIPLRPDKVDEWFSLDARAGYKLNKTFELSVKGENILNSRNYLVKNFDFPFDYRMMGRRVLVGLNAKF